MAASLAQAEEHSEAFLTGVTYDAALKKAAEQKKIVFIDFYTTWCGPCKALDRTTWQDAKVISLLREKAVCLKIDAEKEDALAQRFKLEGYPTLLMIKPDGSVIHRMLGYRDAAGFISEFNDALAGKTSEVRARKSVASATAGGGASQAEPRYASAGF